MNCMRKTLSIAVLLASAACGSHKSVAPVVYGTQPTATGRIYNSQAESIAYEVQRRESRRAVNNGLELTGQRRAEFYSPKTAEIEPVQLQPVSAIYLSEDERVSQKSNGDKTLRSNISSRIVRVRSGDTVYALGRLYNVEPDAIIARNNLRAPFHLKVGQNIFLPPGANDLEPMSLAGAPKSTTRNAFYQVKRGDTLHAVSRETGVSVSKIAQANGLRPPYTLQPGQRLQTPGGRIVRQDWASDKHIQPSRTLSKNRQPKSIIAANASKRDVADITKQISYSPQASSDAMFIWPLRGNVISHYGIGDLGRRNDGINIAAPAGTPVRAAADGEVVYRGSELDGFGNLLLVKHADGYVTAYAHNDAMLVKKGDVVRRGQVIAKVGQTGAVATPQLHFEIRQKLKSVDPIAMLSQK